MKAEPVGTQRHLVGRRLRMADAEIHTKYVFPFVEEGWSVAFYLIDAGVHGPRLFRGSLEARLEGLQTPDPSSKLEPLTALPPSRFDEVVHFDPWWAFKGIGGVEGAARGAYWRRAHTRSYEKSIIPCVIQQSITAPQVA